MRNPNFVEEICKVYARSKVNQYKIAQLCRAQAEKLEEHFDIPEVPRAWRVLLNIADDLERI
jgi:hypothetical protein